MHGVNKGDRVAIYMPMIMETPIVMLACARIGAVHSIVVSVEQVFNTNGINVVTKIILINIYE